MTVSFYEFGFESVLVECPLIPKPHNKSTLFQVNHLRFYSPLSLFLLLVSKILPPTSSTISFGMLFTHINNIDFRWPNIYC